jgi:HlyD family secretion protein
MTKRFWLILGGIVIVVLLVWYVAGRFLSAVEVDAATARIGPIREFVDERAKTRLPQTYLITMPYSARIEPITLTEGTSVKKGEPLAQIAPADLELAVAEATAGLGEAEASIVQNADTKLEEVALRQVRQYVASMKSATEASRKQMESTKAALAYAQSDLARIERLFRTGAESKESLEMAQLRHTQDEIGYHQSVLTYQAMQSFQLATDLLEDLVHQYIARKQLNDAVLKQRKAQIDARLKKALLDLKRGTMTSPVDGVVLRRAFSNERLVPAGTTLLEIGRPEDLEVEADVLSLDVVKVKEGNQVEIYGPAVGKRRAGGTVRRIYPAGFTKISSLGVEQQRVKVIIDISNEDLEWLRRERNLGVGYRVRVRIYTAEKLQATVIPRSALFRGTDGGWRVYAIHNGCAEVRKVQLGLINNESAEITSGLSEGERVVLAPESNLEDGKRVSLKTNAENED